MTASVAEKHVVCIEI